MNAIVRLSPHAFVVWWKDVERWSVGSFVETDWGWPASTIRPLSAALSRKLVDVEREDREAGALRLVTLHFDGEMEPRDESAGDNFKGRLFHADPGDVIYSKIDVRNGAIGIVPEDMGRICVSSEYPVYAVDPGVADARYVKLLFRTDSFRRKINSMISGASGRKRVQPSDLESIAVPLPPLPAQRKIAAAHEAARQYAAEASAKIERLERDIQTRFLAELGLSVPEQATLPKAFGVWWSELERWGVDFNQQVAIRLNPATGKYPVVRLAEMIADLENGWSPKCLDRPAQVDEWGVLKMGAVSFGSFDERQNKALPPELNGRPNLEVRAGDFLISRANITRLVGACALVRQVRPRLMLCDKIFRAVWRDPSLISAQYLDEILKIPHLRQQIEGAVTGTSATMKNITKPSLMALRLPLPPLPIQQAMMKQVEVARAEIARLKADAKARAEAAKADVDAMILGTKPATPL
jgi:type I restriction enzyme S subunit